MPSKANFFRNIGTILTFAFAGTFISAVVLGLFLWLWTKIPVLFFPISFVEAISVGATLSATDPVTILAIFNTYKVDPKLYTVIFGESILNDAIAIVIFETAQRYRPGGIRHGALSVAGFFEAVGYFFLIFFGSLLLGVIVGIATALLLKYTLVRRYPKIESCLVVLIAYASYYFANGATMSGKPSLLPASKLAFDKTKEETGIVTLLFCGITLKHYAYYNMSRRTQLTTKYIFQVMAQLTENFIFIYLGLTLFTGDSLSFRPLFIFITVIGICVARWAAVFPLSKAINWCIRYRARRRGNEVADELPYSYQMMLFWAGLRGAVGVALAAGLDGTNSPTLKATVLVVVVLTVIIFGGTTARMLEIMGIRTGVVEEIDSDDEFDIETVNNGTYYKSNAIGHTPSRSNGTVPPEGPNARANGRRKEPEGSYSSGSSSSSPPVRPTSAIGRKNSTIGQKERDAAAAQQSLLSRDSDAPSDEGLWSDSDLPPAAQTRRQRSPKRKVSPKARGAPGTTVSSAYPPSASGSHTPSADVHLSATGAISQLFSGTSEEHAAWFTQLDEGFIKPHLLLDHDKGGGV